MLLFKYFKHLELADGSCSAFKLVLTEAFKCCVLNDAGVSHVSNTKQSMQQLLVVRTANIWITNWFSTCMSNQKQAKTGLNYYINNKAFMSFFLS